MKLLANKTTNTESIFAQDQLLVRDLVILGNNVIINFPFIPLINGSVNAQGDGKPQESVS